MPSVDNLYPDDYLYLVREIAEIRYKILINADIKHISKDELENEGYIGLVQAVEKFDPKFGKGLSGFRSFATHYINNAISGFLRKEDVIDHRVRKKLREMKKVIEKLQQKFGREPTEDEVAKELKITVEKYRKLQNKAVLIVDLDDAEDKTVDVIVEIHDSEPEEPEKDVKKKNLGKDTDHCLKNTLNKDEMFIILLKEFRSFTLEDIVEIMGQGFHITKVYNINKMAKLRLKYCLEKKGWKNIDILAIYSENY